MTEYHPPRRLFLDGDDATTFLGQHKRIADACELQAATMRDSIVPQLQTIQDRLSGVERAQVSAVEDRHEISRIGARVDRQSRSVRRLAIVVVVALAAACYAAGGTYLEHAKGEKTSWESPTR